MRAAMLAACVMLCAAAASAQGIVADPALAREKTADGALDFPHPKGFTLYFAPGSASDITFLGESGASLAVARVVDAGADPGRFLDSPEARVALTQAIKNVEPSCVPGRGSRKPLANGWSSLGTQARCGPKVPNGAASIVGFEVDGHAYVVTGLGFTLKQTRAFAGMGRVIPLAERPTPQDEARQRQDFRKFSRSLDQVDGASDRRSLFFIYAVRAAAAVLILLAVGLWWLFRRAAAAAAAAQAPDAEAAGFWERGGAFWLDGALVFAIFACARFLAPDDTTASALILLGVAISAVYHTYFIARTGQTPGKMVAGMKVERLGGGPVGVGRAFVRFLIWDQAVWLPFVFGLAAFTARKRTLHDFAADTRVVALPGVSSSRRQALAALGVLGVVVIVVAVIVGVCGLYILAQG